MYFYLDSAGGHVRCSAKTLSFNLTQINLDQNWVASKLRVWGCLTDEGGVWFWRGLTVCMDWNGAALTLMPVLWGALDTGWKTCVWEAGGSTEDGGGCSDDKDMEVCGRRQICESHARLYLWGVCVKPYHTRPSIFRCRFHSSKSLHFLGKRLFINLGVCLGWI